MEGIDVEAPVQGRATLSASRMQPSTRELGQLLHDTTAEEHGGVPTSDTVGKHKPESR